MKRGVPGTEHTPKPVVLLDLIFELPLNADCELLSFTSPGFGDGKWGIQSGMKGGCQAGEHPGLYNMVTKDSQKG